MRYANLSNVGDMSVPIMDIQTNAMTHCSTETDA